LKLDDFANHCWTVLPVAKKTIENYRSAYNGNISKALGSRDMGSIAKSEFLDVLAPLTPQSYMQTLMTLRVLYREAINREIIEESPVAKIRLPRITVMPRKFLTWEEVSGIDFGKYDSQIKFLALHGLRWGEATVLTQEDIRDNKVYITKSKTGPTKTSAGNRIIPYFGFYRPFPKSRHAIANKLHEYGVTIHSLRKTYAYFLKSNQVHVTAAAKFLRHSNPLVTLKIYTLVRDEEVDCIGSIIRKRL
jgi:integrase